MRRIDQTKFGVPDGNCFTACVASLLGLPLTDPDMEAFATTFRAGMLEPMDEAREDAWWSELQVILARRGHQMLYYPVVAGVDVAPFGLAIAAGPSPSSDEHGHAVVVDGGRIVHDPNPAKKGLGGPPAGYTLVFPFLKRST